MVKKSKPKIWLDFSPFLYEIHRLKLVTWDQKRIKVEKKVKV